MADDYWRWPESRWTNPGIDWKTGETVSAGVDVGSVSSTCVIFAKTEAIGLLRKGWPKEKVLAAYSAAMAHRVAELIQRIGLVREFAITGGIAKNEGILKRIENELKTVALKPNMDTQIAGALGAALLAKDLADKRPQPR